MPKTVAGYSSIQIGLHWAVVVLVAFQYVAHSGIEASWNALQRNGALPPDSMVLSYMHIGAGLTVLVLALIRIALRFTHGAPPPPANEPWLLKFVSEAVHMAIYGLLLLLPLSGLAAWVFAIELAATAHVLMKNALLAAIVLHILGALFQHFIRRSDVLMRMLRPEADRRETPARTQG